MIILICAVLAVLLACICVTGWEIRKESRRAVSREAELTRRIDEARKATQTRQDAYIDQIAALSKRVSEYWNYVQKLGDAAKELADKCVALEKQVAEIPTDQLQEIYDSEKQFQAGLNAIMNFGQQSYGLTKERVRDD